MHRRCLAPNYSQNNLQEAKASHSQPSKHTHKPSFNHAKSTRPNTSKLQSNPLRNPTESRIKATPRDSNPEYQNSTAN
ncbi:hypothetical protein V6N13_092409 [Hibiscus sabdariffa]|uniref:Uncharacterized protein n=1 Tax=Hibiscus sabdariffa TaxID=183260 RepID=A0ABR2CCR7_9ROSI